MANYVPTPYKLISAASTNAKSVKSSGGLVFSITICNTSTTALGVLKLYDLAAAPNVGTDTPVLTLPIAAATGSTQPSSFTLSGTQKGILFTNGIALAITGAVADADTTAVAAGAVIVNLIYQ